MLMLLISILICAAALFLGWTLGPLGLKVATKIKQSADESEKRAKAGEDYEFPFHEMITPEHHEVHEFAAQKRGPFLIFIPLALALIFNKPVLWLIVVVMFISIIWKEVIRELGHTIAIIWGFIFMGEKEEKKK